MKNHMKTFVFALVVLAITAPAQADTLFHAKGPSGEKIVCVASRDVVNCYTYDYLLQQIFR